MTSFAGAVPLIADLVRAISPEVNNKVSPGVLGFLVVAGLGLATWLLIRSMTRQMRKIDLPDERDDSADTSRADEGRENKSRADDTGADRSDG